MAEGEELGSNLLQVLDRSPTDLGALAPLLCAKPVDTIATDDVLAVLKPIWTTKAETASRMRGRIEKVLDAAKAKGFREGENPARWRGHLDHLLPRPSKLSRGHHAAMAYEEVAAFVSKLRDREATSALALELRILTAARSGEILGMRSPEIDFNKKIWTVPVNRMASYGCIMIGPAASRTRSPSPMAGRYQRLEKPATTSQTYRRLNRISRNGRRQSVA